MPAIRKVKTVAPTDYSVPGDSVFDDADALIAQAQRSFDRAAKAQVAENDRLGIATHGAVDGKLVERRPRSSGKTHHA
jgi:hypothetical protein